MSDQPRGPVDWVSAALFLLSGMLLGYAIARVVDVGFDIGSVVVPVVVGFATLAIGVQSVRRAAHGRPPP